jgi:hypothetical protein
VPVDRTGGPEDLHLAAVRQLQHPKPRTVELQATVRVPANEADAVRAVQDRCPPASSFGIEERSYGLALKPELLCETLVPWIMETLDCLMAATDVTCLPGVSPQGLRTGPPSDEEPRGLFSPQTAGNFSCSQAWSQLADKGDLQ